MKKILGSLIGLAVLAAPALAFASVSISLQGGSVTVVQGQSYSEPGYSALSTTDGDVTNLVSVSNPGTSQVGTFTIGYDVTDSALDTGSASRSLTVRGTGGGMVPCSGPEAPGWNVSLPGGGCNMDSLVGYGHVLNDGSLCPFFGGCIDVPSAPYRIVTSTPADIGL